MKKPKWIAKVQAKFAGQKTRRQARWYGGFETKPLVLRGSRPLVSDRVSASTRVVKGKGE